MKTLCSTQKRRKSRLPAFVDRRTVLLAAAALAAAGCGPQAAVRAGPADRMRRRAAERRGVTLPDLPDDLPTDPIDHPFARRGPRRVDIAEGVWTDTSRGGRQVPWIAYLPQAEGRVPAAIFSHGGGGTRETARPFGEHLASHGVASVHVQHFGSDRQAFIQDAQQIARAVNDPALAAPRFEDIAFAADQLRSGEGAPGARIDPVHLGIYGHSFGAITTLVAVGQSVSGHGRSFAVPGLKAAAALSPSPPRPGFVAEPGRAFSDMTAPILHLTGTEDHAPNGDFDAPARRIPFDAIDDVDQTLIVLRGANHFSFTGAAAPSLRGMNFGYPGLARHHDVIKASLVAFFRHRLSGDTDAGAFLSGRGLARFLAPGSTLEHKEAS